MPTSPISGSRTVAVWIAALLSCSAGCSDTLAATVPLDVQIRARSVAPGEPIRVVVRSPVTLATLRGSFLGQPVAMVRTGVEDEQWSGWAMVGLDQEASPAVIEVAGFAEDGREALGTRAVMIEGKRFPTEELSVAPAYVTPPPEVQERLARERRKLAALYNNRTAVAPPPEPFTRPVPGEPTSIFGTRRFFNGEPRSPHPGLDLRADHGAPVLAAGAGKVVLAEELYYSGNIVILDHGGGLFTLYAHLSDIRVQEGQDVPMGHEVGLAGATGRVTGPHLHWGAKIGDRPFDPTALLDEALFR